MPDIYLIAFELIVLALLIVCLRHAWRAGPEAVARLAAGVIFGVLLELATIWQLEAYHYGRFLLMISDVPLSVGAGWGVIIYSAGLFSDATGLPEWVRPILDGLLALNIDLAMDAIAIRLGMWDWGIGFEVEYFGVPYANFWAWFWVVFFFSAGVRWQASWVRGSWRWLVPLGAVLIGVAGVLGTNALIVYGVPRHLYKLTIGLTLGFALLLVLWHRPRITGHMAAPIAFWVPFGFHAYFLAAGLLSGQIFNPPVLLVVSILMLAISVYLHYPALKAQRAE